MDALLQCQVSPGMFKGEVAVRGISADGTEFSLFVSDEYVECRDKLQTEVFCEGRLRVQVLDREGPLVLVRLPGQTFENGRTVAVSDSMVEVCQHHQPA